MKSLFLFVSSMFMTLCLTSCADWGQEDPVAGNQVYPTRQVVATYDFEYSEEKPEFSDIDLTNQLCEIVKDNNLGSNVLHIANEGGARIVNPFNSVKLQNGAGLAFWVKVESADTDRPLMSFGYESSDSARLVLMQNGQLSYSESGQESILNSSEVNSDDASAELLTKDEWHFVALQVSNDSYTIYVDSVQRLTGSNADVDYSKLVNFINTAPYIYVGTQSIGDSHNSACFDKITLIRNQMVQSDWEQSAAGSSSKVFINIGASDCSTAWWSAFSDYFTIPSGNTFHTQLINHTSGATNWNNWNLVLTNDVDRGGTGYSEYFVVRSDIFGWGNGYVASNFSSEGYPSTDDGWKQFRADMEGAIVDLTVTRNGATVKVTAVATCSNGTVYKETYTQDCGDGSQNVRAFLAVDNSYLQLDPEETYIGTKYNSGSYLVGNADFSSLWWTAFSDAYDFTGNISEDNPFVLHFINNNSGSGASYNNWLLVCTTGGYSAAVPNKGGSGSEHYVIRSDAFGWGDSNYSADNIVSSFNSDTYVSDMHGAECWIGLSRSGSTVTMNAVQQKTNEEFLPSYSFSYVGASGTVGFFLTAELASLNMLDVAYYPYFKYIGKTE